VGLLKKDKGNEKCFIQTIKAATHTRCTHDKRGSFVQPHLHLHKRHGPDAFIQFKHALNELANNVRTISHTVCIMQQ